MHLVVISKLPEFTPDGEVVPGQCEPYTTGWKLRLFDNGRAEGLDEDRSEATGLPARPAEGTSDEAGSRQGRGAVVVEELLSGSYYEVRRIQRRCLGKSADEIREIAAEALEAMREGAVGPPASDEADESTQILGIEDVRRAMLQMELSAGVSGGRPDAEWVEFSVHDGVSVASVRPGSAPADPDEFGRVIGAALGAAERGLVVDLADGDAGADRLIRVLRDLGERAKAENRFFCLARAPEDLARAMGDAEVVEVVGLYPDVESALGSALNGPS